MVDTLGTNLVLGLFILAVGHQCAPVDQKTEIGAMHLAVPGNKVNGESLIEVGKISHLDFIEMIGNAVKNAEALSDSVLLTSLEESLKGNVSEIENKLCMIEPCSSWTRWSECSAGWFNGNTFGMKRRFRTCWLNETSPCDRSGNGTIEERAEICKGNCPSPYEVSNRNTSSLCLQFHTTRKNRDSAEAICQENGGHILNPDTEDRWQVAKEFKTSTGSVWLDGKRTNSSSPFIYMNGVEPEKNGLSYWTSGEPGPSDTCKAGYNVPLQWYGRSCYDKYVFICEKRA